MKEKHLRVADSVLHFVVDESDWCRVTFDCGAQQIPLGADTWRNIHKKFESLSRPCTSTEPEWVLSLAEHHCSLYRQETDKGMAVFWQDANAKTFWHAVLAHPIPSEELP